MSKQIEDQFPDNDQEKLLLLFQKYKLGNITAAEQNIFMGLVCQPEMEEMLKDLIDNEIKAIDTNKLPAGLVQPDEKAANILKRILAEEKKSASVHFIENTLKENDEITEPEIGRKVSYRWLKYAAAILLLITISISIIRQNNKKEEMAVVTTPEKGTMVEYIKPGGNRAILKLADGTVILLDTATNGLLSEEGNAAVTKQKDGELVYQAIDKNETAAVYNTLSTPGGGVFQLTLPDGTKVWLNAASSIKYPTAFTGNERKVEVSGEAYFEVAHSPAMPFRVNISNRAEVEVLGTHFNVNSYDEEKEMKVTLLEGKVRFSPVGVNEVVNAHRKILEPGQQGRLNNPLQASAKGNESISVTDKVDIEEVMAWTKGEFRFKNMPVDYLLRQAARWYNVQIEYRVDPSNITLSGVITRKDNITKFLEVITATRKVQFSAEGRKIIVEKFRDR